MSVDLSIIAERRDADGWQLAVRWYEGPKYYFGEPDQTETDFHCESIPFDEDHRWQLRGLLGNYEHALRDLTPLPSHDGIPDDASETLRRFQVHMSFTWGWRWTPLSEWLRFDWDTPASLRWDTPAPRSEPTTYRALAGERFFTETLAKLQSLGDPENVRVIWFFY
jgi:hypothetical protein